MQDTPRSFENKKAIRLVHQGELNDESKEFTRKLLKCVGVVFGAAIGFFSGLIWGSMIGVFVGRLMGLILPCGGIVSASVGASIGANFGELLFGIVGAVVGFIIMNILDSIATKALRFKQKWSPKLHLPCLGCQEKESGIR